MASPRRPLVVLVAIGVVVVLVFALGAGLGGQDAEGAGGWQGRLSGIGAGARLSPEDLEVIAGACEVGPTAITASGGCTLAVAESGGFLGLGSAVRRARVENLSPAPVRLVLVVEGRTITTTVDAHKEDDADDAEDDEADLTFSGSGGELRLQCAPLQPECTLALR